MAILINDNSARVEYTATSGQTVFTVPFEFFANDDLNVYRNGTLITYDATPANANEYSVSGAGVTGGGSITLGAGATLNDTLLIVRDIAVERVSDFPTSGPFPIDSLNTDLDTIVAIEQQLETKIDQRTLHLSESDSPNSLDALPAQATRANKVLGFDADGQPTQSTNTLSQIDTAVSTTLSGTLPITRGGTGATTASGARSNLGLGSIATQSSSSVAITGGSVSGITDLAIADGGTGASNVTDARSNLGLGTAATQDADSIAITGGSVTGITDLAIADGGTGASNAADARTNLNAAISGANADITSMSGVTGGISTPDYIDFDTGAAVSRATGRLWWDNSDSIGSLNLGMAGSDVTMQLGQETFLRIKASAAITNGQVVMFTGTVGASGGLTAAPASGLTKSTGTYVLGVATESIAENGWGYITHFGVVRGANTAAFSDGDVLYLDPSVAGGLTTTIPAAPNPKVEVAAVIHAHASSGILFVRPHSFPELANLADVDGPSATDTYLKWDGSDFVWSPVTGATGGTVTSVDVSGGTTGLSFSGGPITTTGTITASGTLGVANGGTGASSLTSGYLVKGNGTSAVTASVVYDDGTNVGIGTSSPVSRVQFHQPNGASSNYCYFTNGDSGATLSDGFFIGLSSAEDARIILNENNPMLFGTNGTERMRIDSSGNVGIGTTAPSYILDIEGSTANTSRINVLRTGGSGVGVQLLSTGNDGGVAATNSGPLNFYTSSTSRMKIDSSGNVGIGTTSPPSKISVYGTGNFNNDADGTVPGSGSFKYRGTAGGTTLTTYDYLNYTAMQFIRDNGNPTNTVGSITCTDTATTYNTSSDRRLKKDIVPAGDAGGAIDAIQVVSHGWKNGEGVVPFGVIAQDLHAVAPQAVHEGDEGEEIESVWGVDYSKLVPMLVKEIQSLRARVAELETSASTVTFKEI